MMNFPKALRFKDKLDEAMRRHKQADAIHFPNTDEESEIANKNQTNLFKCNSSETIISATIEESILIVVTTQRVVAVEVPESE